MTYKLDNYRHLYIPRIRQWGERLGTDDLVALAMTITTSYDCPCIVSAKLVGEIYGFSDSLLEWIKRLEEFSPSNTAT